MKLFKNTISIVVLFTISSVSARVASTTATNPVIQPQPPVTKITTPPIIQRPPVMQTQSYKDLVAYVKNAPNIWDNTRGILRTDFVTAMIQKSRASNLETFQLEALLQTARDIHGIFSGNQNKDIAILQSCENQITAAVRQI